MSGDTYFVDLASEPGGQRIAGVFMDLGNGTERLGLATWTGSAWVNPGEYDSQTRDVNDNAPGDFVAGMGWVGTSGTAVAIYQDNQTATLDWARWTSAGGWVLQTDVTLTGKGFTESVQIESFDNQTKLMALFSDSNSDLYAATYDGTTWTVTNSGSALETVLSFVDSAPFSFAIGPLTAAITGTSPASLTEGNLNGATVTVEINGTYNASLLTTDFSLNGAPTGTTINSVVRDSPTQATLTLAFDGTDFDTNASLSVTVLQAALATGTGPVTTGTVTVTAVLEVSAAITGTNPASLTETNLNGATVTVTLTDGTYNVSLVTTNFTLNGAPTGTTMSGVVRDSPTQATLTLAFDGTDFDANASMSVTVLQAALATGTGPATTGTVTVTAVLEVSAAITGTNPASLTETNLNGATVTVTLTGGTYDASLFTTDFALNGAPAGTTINSVVRDSATQATLTLAFDGTDFDTNAALGVTVLQAALATGTGPAATGTVTVTAVVEATAAITGTNPASLTETNLNGATVTVTITNGTYNVSLVAGNFTLNGAPAGTTINSVVRDSGTQATLTLAFDGTDFDTNASLGVTVLQAALATGTGPATTGTVTVTAAVEADLQQVHYRWRDDDGAEGDSTPWYDVAWSYRKRITVNAAKVGADVTNFPVYVNLANLGADFFANVLSAGGTDGGDIRVTRSDGVTELPRQVVAINVGAQTGELHFKADSLSSATNTSFYIYYRNASASEPAPASTYGSQNVWTNGYVGVWHLKEDQAGTGTVGLYKDSTANANDGDDFVSATGQTGKLGDGHDFDGADDYVGIGNPASLNISGAVTVEAWINLNVAQGSMDTYARVVNKWWGSSGGYGLFFDSTNSSIGINTANGTTQDGISATVTFTPGTWYHVVGTWSPNPGTKAVFINGTQQASTASANASIAVVPQNVELGGDATASSLNGKIDEVRISTVPRPATWIATEFNNQDNPAVGGFLASIGSQQALSAVGATWAADADTPLYGLATAMLRRLRIEVSNEAAGTASNVEFRLEVSGPLSTATPGTCAATSYFTLPTADWQIVDSTWLTDGAATTNVSGGLPDENTNFVDGQVKDAGNQTTGITLTPTDFTEVEYALQATGSAVPGALYCFRVTNAGATTNFSYTRHAQVTIAGVDHFTVEAAGGGAIATQVEETAFNIRVTALDYAGTTVTGFGGTAEITSTGVLAAGGGTTAAFTSGVLASHSVAMGDPGTFTLTATQTSGTAAGTSNSFSVTALTPFGFRQAITIDRTKVPAGCGPTLPDFPLLVSVTHLGLATTPTGNVTDPEGDDILFRAVDDATCGGAGTAPCTLDHEIEKYVGSTGELVAWVRVPSLKTNDPANTSNTIIYIYYGNSDITSSIQNASGVWDGNYMSVWHLKEDPTGASPQMTDSTSNASHGSTEGSWVPGASVNAKVGKGLQFDGTTSNRLIRVLDKATLDGTNDEGTFGLWINWTNAADGDSQFVMSSSNRFTTGANDGYEWASQGTGNHFFYPWGGDGNNYNLAANPFTNGNWHHVVVTLKFSTKEVKIYVDGSPLTFTTTNVPTYC